jgi:hypothetical protein
MRKIILAAVIAIVPVVAAAQSSGGSAAGAAGGSAGSGANGAAGATGGSNGSAGGIGGAAGGAATGSQSDAGSGGSANGAPAGGITANLRPRFRAYVTQHEVPSYTYDEGVRVGTVLPEAGITYGEVPAEYGVQGYRYTIINNQPVIVEPRTRRIIQVIE